MTGSDAGAGGGSSSSPRPTPALIASELIFVGYVYAELIVAIVLKALGIG